MEGFSVSQQLNSCSCQLGGYLNKLGERKDGLDLVVIVENENGKEGNV